MKFAHILWISSFSELSFLPLFQPRSFRPHASLVAVLRIVPGPLELSFVVHSPRDKSETSDVRNAASEAAAVAEVPPLAITMKDGHRDNADHTDKHTRATLLS